MTEPSDSRGGANDDEGTGRFVIVPRAATSRSGAGAIDRWPAVRRSLEDLLAECDDIVGRGTDEFFAPRSLTYRAAEAIIVHFDDIVTRRIPVERQPLVPSTLSLKAVTATRNIVAHNYTAADAVLVWEVIEHGIPDAIRHILIGDNSHHDGADVRPPS